ncbi:MAG: cyclopropane-fatty-acyl-phospholipid synthase, partial [Pseudonocardiales bacterium]|nr:cyclopropane-fatty-acyl-phospholipid synthase [Pseudonocardiales bacterium]
MTVAETLDPLMHAALGNSVPIGIRAWDGSVAGPSDAVLRLNIRNRRALRRLLWSPNELGFARAYVSGDIEVEGDVLAALQQLAPVASPENGPGVTV